MNENESKIPNRVVETYAEDMARVIESNTEKGLIKRIIEGEEEKENLKKNLSPRSRKNRIFLDAGIVLFVLAAVLFYVLFSVRDKINTVPVLEETRALIFLDQSSFLDVSLLNKEKVLRLMVNEAEATEVKEGGIEGIYLTVDNKIVGLRNFIAMIKGSFDVAGNSFISDQFLFGVVNDREKNPFILIKVRSFADVYDPMRVWEAKMFYDLYGLFGPEVNSETSYLLSKDFEDVVVDNKNARALYDKEGSPVLLYVFVDENSVVIARKEEAIRTVRERLAAGEVKK